MPEEPDDGWADEKWNALGFLLKNFPVIAVVMGLVAGGLAATSFQGVGGSGYTPSGGGGTAGRRGRGIIRAPPRHQSRSALRGAHDASAGHPPRGVHSAFARVLIRRSVSDSIDYDGAFVTIFLYSSPPPAAVPPPFVHLSV